tara:strand:+ start:449 stop:556 length:108 start_codon:yes stop_codon:yes gene_type:complete
MIALSHIQPIAISQAQKKNGKDTFIMNNKKIEQTF